jgi:dolichol-phosphate mannosyltransferase
MLHNKNISPTTPLVTIIPATFNEKDNIAPLIKKIRAAMKDLSYNYEILFADDSNDDTPQEIKKFTEKYSNVKYLQGPGKGLSAAFIEAFDKARSKYIICMDADLQHPPSLLPELITQLEAGAQMSIASRYIPGGSNEGLGKLWSFYGIYRRLVSTSMSYLTRILFIPIRKTTDPMTGFFGFRKDLIISTKLEAKGFKILVEILMRTKPEKVAEVPLKFQPREHEASKATITQGINFFKHLKQLFFELPEAARFLKFCLVGMSGVLINLGLLYVLVEGFKIQKVVAFTISIAISILTNYFFNSRFTYRDNRSKSKRESIKRLGYYYTFAGLTMFINLAIYHELINNFGVHYLVAAFFGIIITVLLNFILVTKIIWKLPADI